MIRVERKLILFLDLVRPFYFYFPKLSSYPFVQCSKYGRPPSKKQKERKILTRVGKQLNISSPDFGGTVDIYKLSFVY